MCVLKSYSFECHIRGRQTQILSVQSNVVEFVLVLAHQTAVITAVCTCCACVWSAVLFKLQHFINVWPFKELWWWYITLAIYWYLNFIHWPIFMKKL